MAVDTRRMGYRCCAATLKHAPCKRRVRVADQRCYQHPGRSAWRVTDVSATRRRQCEVIARVCADVLSDGAADVIASRAAECVTDKSWTVLVEQHSSADCSDLARLARAILCEVDRVGGAIGQAVGVMVGSLGGSETAVAFSEEFVNRLPLVLPLKAKLVVAARALQVAGIYVCLVSARPLADCECLADVLKVEGEKQLESVVRGSLQNWRRLAPQS